MRFARCATGKQDLCSALDSHLSGLLFQFSQVSSALDTVKHLSVLYDDDNEIEKQGFTA